MAYQDKKPYPFRPGQSDAARRRNLNELARAVPRSVRGVGNVNVQQFGDRLTISNPDLGPRYAPPEHYTQQFVVLEIHEDLLLCVPFRQPDDGTRLEPQEYDPALEEDNTTFVWVAKPYLLQQTPWDTKSVTIFGIAYTVAYTDVDERTLEGSTNVDQKVTPPYLPGDVVHAYRGPTGYYAEVNGQEYPVEWTDLNDGGRTWLDQVSNSLCCTLAGLIADDCLRLTRLAASGACACADPSVDLLLTYDVVESEWTTDERVEVCGVEYQPVFVLAGGLEKFGLRTTTGGSGGETTYWAVRACCCGDDCLVFVLGGDICTAVRDCPATPPSQNVLKFSVAWERCPNPNYHGPGWYLVDGDCVLYDTDPGTCAVIEAGPFDTEEACGDLTPDPPSCLGLTFANGAGAGTLVISNGTGGCVCAEGTVPGSSGAGVDTKSWATTGCPGNQTISLSCSGGVYSLSVSGGATATLVSSSADPFVLVYDVASANCTGSPTGTYRVTITHPGA